MYDTCLAVNLNEEQSHSQDWNRITVDSLVEAQDLLDALEEARFAQRKVRVLDASRFQVAWK